MRIAVIENNGSYIQSLQNCFKKNEQWQVDYFNNSTEFGEVPIKEYHIIIADNELPDISGLTLLRSISKKSSADLALIGTHKAFVEEEVKEKIDSISNIFDIQNTENIVDWIHYVEAKLRIQKMVQEEEDSLTNIALATNGHVITIKDGVAVLGVSGQVENKNNEKVISIFDQTEYRIVTYFLDGTKVNSSQLSVLVRVYKDAESHGGKLVLWNKNQDPFVKKLMHECTLDRIIKSFDDLDNAINYVKDKSNW